MARGRKPNLTVEQKIEVCKKEIQELEDKLISKKQELDNLNVALDDAKKERLFEAIKASGKSVDDVLELLK